jgi:hypothetical protein
VLTREQRWRPVDPPRQLGDVEKVPAPVGTPLEQDVRRHDYWWQLFNPDQRDARWARDLFQRPIDDSEPPPECAVTVLAMDDSPVVVVALGPPVDIQKFVHRAPGGGITEDVLDELVVVLRRWPALGAVEVDDLGSHASVIRDGLAARGIEASVVPVELVDPSAYYAFVRDSDDDPPTWSLELIHRKTRVRPSFKFGDDAAALATFVRPHAGTGLLQIDAPSDKVTALGRELDALSIPWRRKRRDWDTSFEGRADADGLTLSLVMHGSGWIDLVLEIDRPSTVVGSAAFGDPLTGFVAAVRKALTYRRTTYCEWYREPGASHVVIAPGAAEDLMRIELWFDKSEIDRGARTGEFRGCWEGSAHALGEVTYRAARNLDDAAGPYGIEDLWASRRRPPSWSCSVLGWTGTG